MASLNYYRQQAQRCPQQRVEIDYTNYRGERSRRVIFPLWLTFSTNDWHPERQWLLHAFCMKSDDLRAFAMKDIHEWKPADAHHSPQKSEPEFGPAP